MNKLENVKVGDKLLVSNQYGERIETIVRVTNTLVITRCSNRYRKKMDGVYLLNVGILNMQSQRHH